MNRESGYTLIELILYLGVGGVGVFLAFTLWGSERMTSREQEQAMRASAAISETLSVLADDLRDAERAVPRQSGPGAVVFFPAGSAAVWYDRPREPGVLYRKLVRPGGTGDRERVVSRRIERLAIECDGRLVTARAVSGRQERAITVRRRP